MGGDSIFTFKANALTTFHVTVKQAGVEIRSEGGNDGRYTRNWAADFAEVKEVSVHEFANRRHHSASVTFQPKSGPAVTLLSSVGLIGATEGDLIKYRKAAAAALQAFAQARPDAQVRMGRSAAQATTSVLVLALVGIGLSALFLAQTWPPTDYAWTGVAAIFLMMFAFGASRLKLLKKPVFVSVKEAAAEAARKANNI